MALSYYIDIGDQQSINWWTQQNCQYSLDETQHILRKKLNFIIKHILSEIYLATTPADCLPRKSYKS